MSNGDSRYKTTKLHQNREVTDYYNFQNNMEIEQPSESLVLQKATSVFGEKQAKPSANASLCRSWEESRVASSRARFNGLDHKEA